MKIIIIVFLFLMFRCNEDEVTSINSEIYPIEQKVLFEFSYNNYAWGHQHQGWIIDNSGQIHGYKLPKDWKYPDKDEFISKSDLENNLSKTDTVYGQIDRARLFTYYQLIDKVKDGQLSENKHTAYDAGTRTFYCYYWDNERIKYKRILLDLKGDFSQENLHPDTKKIMEFLEQINANVNKKL